MSLPVTPPCNLPGSSRIPVDRLRGASASPLYTPTTSYSQRVLTKTPIRPPTPLTFPPIDWDSPGSQNELHPVPQWLAPKTTPTEALPESQDFSKNIRIPPIILQDPSKWVSISKYCLNKSIHYNSAKSYGLGVCITVATSADFRALRSYLTQTDTQFHCYSLPEERFTRVIYRHIHPLITCDDIKEDLEPKGFHPHLHLQAHHRPYKTPYAPRLSGLFTHRHWWYGRDPAL